MVVAIACYWAIHALVINRSGSGTVTPLLPAIFIGESVLMYGLAWWWYARTIHAVQEQIAPTKFQRLSPQDRVELQRRLQAATIICVALFEAPAVIGLVNSLIASSMPRLFEWFAWASLACLTLFRITGYPAIFDALDKMEVRDVEVR